MNKWIRVAGLAICAAFGLAMAIGLAHSFPGNGEPGEEPSAPRLAARMIAAEPLDAAGESASIYDRRTVRSPSPARESDDANGPSASIASTDHRSPDPANSAPAQQAAASSPIAAPAPMPAPQIIVAPMPVYGQQLVPESERARLQQAYDFIKQHFGKEAADGIEQQKGGASEASAAPPAPPNHETDVRVLPTPGRSSSTAKNDRSAPKLNVDRAGDGRFSIQISNAELREVLDFLSEQSGLNILAGTSVQGKVSASLTGVDIHSALDAILKSTGYVARREGPFIYVGTADEFNLLEQSLDRIGTRVYRPNYVTAAELQKLIQPMLTEKVGIVSVSTQAEAGIASDAANAGGDKFAGADVVVVRDYEAVLAMVDQVVAEVDVRPLQVHIEAMILSVKLKDTDRYGVNFELLRDKHNIKLGIGAPESTLANVKYEKGSLKFGFLDSSLGAFLEALETIGDTNVVASPHLMVLNKHRAEIQIGEQKGYVSTTVTETASTQAVQFLDVGALLRLRPFISSDGMIRMEVHPELSDGAVKTESGFTLPEKEVTQVTTNIMVRDGCTVVIGGLMRENLAVARQQVPFVGNLPLIGFLFRSSTETTERREVIVLITPHIVYEQGAAQSGAAAACEYQRRQAHYFDKMTPINKRLLGQKYFRLAQNAWNAGDSDRALRFAELAAHIDPLNREALELRSQIWTGRRAADDGTFGVAPLSPQQALDDPNTVNMLLDEVDHAAAAAAAPQHPLETGRPGRKQEIVRPLKLQP